MKSPTSMGHLLTDGAEILTPLLARVKRLQDISAVLAHLLPAPLAQSCQAANIRDHTLIIATDSSAWATRLCYHAPALLQQLQRQQGLGHLTAVKIRVLPTNRPGKKPITHQVTLSRKSATLIADLADALGQGTLSAALQRLARHSRPE